MKIRIGYHFDGGSFLDDLHGKTAAEGVVTTGPLGLVGILETRLGISAPQYGQPVRTARYLAAMDRLGRTGDPFYKASLRADGWSSAKSLLALRDQLRLSGWDGSDPGGSARLSDMAALEAEDGDISGLPERIDAVLETVAAYGLEGVSEVMVCGRGVADWPSCWRRIFDALAESGVRVAAETPAPTSEGVTDLERLHRVLCTGGGGADFRADGSLVRLEAATALEAADAVAAWLAAGDTPEGSLAIIAASGGEVLDGAMRRYGLPRPGGGGRSPWRAALQLLPLGLGIHWAPFDPQRYLEFLTAPICPLHPAMAGELARALEREPGIGGEAWGRAVARCEAWAEGRPGQATHLESLNFWTAIRRAFPHTGLDAQVVIDVCRRLGEWTAKGARSAEGSLMEAVSGMAQELADAVAETGRALIPKPQLDRMLDSVIGGGAALVDKAEAAPWGVLSHPGQLGGPADMILWWNFTMEGMPSCRAPWTRAETEAMLRASVHLDDLELERDMEIAAWPQAACNAVKQLVLVMPGQDGGEPLPPHPFWENIVAAMPLSESDDIPAMTVSAARLRRGEESLMGRNIPLAAVPKRAAPAFQEQWKAPRQTIGRREKESPSGMSSLIQCPLSWVLNHVLKVDATGSPVLPNGNQLRGSFGHSIIEDLIGESREWEPEAAAKRAGEMFEARLKERAAVYLLPGMEAEREHLRYRLERAVFDLFARIRAAGLMVVESERCVERADDLGQTYRGFVDISLEDGAGNPVVWDMKWTGSSKKYREMMQKGAALQLAAYCWMLDNGGPRAYGAYYMLAQAQLIASDAPWLPSTDIEDSDLKGTWETARTIYDGILDELAAGKVRAIVPDEDDGERELDLGSGCFFCRYGKICGVDYE